MQDFNPLEKEQQWIAKEKLKARALRKSQWWKNKIAKGICYYCKERFSPKELTMDHIVPLSRGGRSTKNNIVPCCKSCNNKKKNLTPVDIILNDLKSRREEKTISRGEENNDRREEGSS